LSGAVHFDSRCRPAHGCDLVLPRVPAEAARGGRASARVLPLAARWRPRPPRLDGAAGNRARAGARTAGPRPDGAAVVLLARADRRGEDGDGRRPPPCGRTRATGEVAASGRAALR